MRLGLIVDTGVQTLVIVVVKTVGDAGLRVGQVGKKGRSKFSVLAPTAVPKRAVAVAQLL
jgi:hypothetical protein